MGTYTCKYFIIILSLPFFSSSSFPPSLLSILHCFLLSPFPPLLSVFVHACTHLLGTPTGIKTEGIFRVPGSKARIDEVLVLACTQFANTLQTVW